MLGGKISNIKVSTQLTYHIMIHIHDIENHFSC